MLLFRVNLVRFCQALRFSLVFRDLWILLPGLQSPPALQSRSFPKRLSGCLVLRDLLHFFLINSAISWNCLINQLNLFLFNHHYIWYFMSQMFVWILNFQRILTSSFCSALSSLSSHHFSDAGRWYFLHRFQYSIEAIFMTPFKPVCTILQHEMIKWSIVSPFFLHNGYLLSSVTISILALMALVHRAWSWAAIKKPSVSFFSSPFFSQLQMMSLSVLSLIFLMYWPWRSLLCHRSRCFCSSFLWYSLFDSFTLSSSSLLFCFQSSVPFLM